jgi:hypothetical protein
MIGEKKKTHVVMKSAYGRVAQISIPNKCGCPTSRF